MKTQARNILTGTFGLMAIVISAFAFFIDLNFVNIEAEWNEYKNTRQPGRIQPLPSIEYFETEIQPWHRLTLTTANNEEVRPQKPVNRKEGNTFLTND